MVRITKFGPTENYKEILTFTGNSVRQVDLEKYLRGKMFERIRNDSEFFRSVHVDQDLGTIVWGNGADIDPDVLCENSMPAWQEDELMVVRK